MVSCPTCGRTRIDLIGLANQVEKLAADYPLDLKVAVMGCVVNGPGRPGRQTSESPEATERVC